MTTGQVIYA